MFKNSTFIHYDKCNVSNAIEGFPQWTEVKNILRVINFRFLIEFIDTEWLFLFIILTL